MVKLIIGVKGTGKTKTLIEMVNNAQKNTNGCVVCIEKGNKLRYDVNSQIRLIDTVEYLVSDAQSLYGFVAGILASNYDVTDIFIDSCLKICNEDVAAFEKFLLEVEALSLKNNVNVVITSSVPTEETTDVMRKFI
jgi:ABC-type phosphate/phosphonate transport system ATPase subunit